MSGVIVDTCIWSLALRGKTPRNKEVAEELALLKRILSSDRAKRGKRTT